MAVGLSAHGAANRACNRLERGHSAGGRQVRHGPSGIASPPASAIRR